MSKLEYDAEKGNDDATLILGNKISCVYRRLWLRDRTFELK